MTRDKQTQQIIVRPLRTAMGEPLLCTADARSLAEALERLYAQHPEFRCIQIWPSDAKGGTIGTACAVLERK